MDDTYYMKLALDEAQKAEEHNEVPVGAILVDTAGKVIGQGYNCPISENDPTSHAEIKAIRSACRVMNNYRLPGTTLYVTIEPCIMCMGAIIHTRVQRVVFGALDPKWGAAVSLYRMGSDLRLNHQPEIIQGICEKQTKHMIKSFFKQKRRNRDKHSCCGHPMG
ncbi:MAG: tRNA adenosine(34) deaminase TadA [Desulfobacter postgatei]|uniref:tRNA-specific adenosine deaminase n=1 Tax=Desulfobacter postgatei TaxID=2293 RepID=A0A2G6MQ70_9BACT|nr:MAG: tRNA adenosine(34) deaminase TadA [Desulfobacter postgatei]